MKRIVCLLLALVLCAYLPCAAFAVSSPGSSAPTVPSTDNPKTGDTSMINIWVIVMILALLALIVAVVVFRKSKKD